MANHKSLDQTTIEMLGLELSDNVLSEGKEGIHMGKDTKWIPKNRIKSKTDAADDETEDDKVVSVIKSIPSHY